MKIGSSDDREKIKTTGGYNCAAAIQERRIQRPAIWWPLNDNTLLTGHELTRSALELAVLKLTLTVSVIQDIVKFFFVMSNRVHFIIKTITFIDI